MFYIMKHVLINIMYYLTPQLSFVFSDYNSGHRMIKLCLHAQYHLFQWATAYKHGRRKAQAYTRG